MLQAPSYDRAMSNEDQAQLFFSILVILLFLWSIDTFGLFEAVSVEMQ